MNDQVEVPVNEQLDGLKAQADLMEETPVTKAEVKAAEEQAKVEKQSAEGAAAILMGAVQMGVGLVAPYVEIPENQADDVVQKVAPVLEKYGVHTGGAWEMEIRALMAVGTLGVVIYGQIKAHHAEKAANDEAQKNAA